MSELEQRARERLDILLQQNDYVSSAWGGINTLFGVDKANAVFVNMLTEFAHETVRSIISGMEERIKELNKTDEPPAPLSLRAGRIAELEAQIAGLKKKFGLEGM